MTIKAYQHVTGCFRINNPEEKELADRLDKEFTELFKAVPKANRRALINMLHLVQEFCAFESLRGYILGQKQMINC